MLGRRCGGPNLGGHLACGVRSSLLCLRFRPCAGHRDSVDQTGNVTIYRASLNIASSRKSSFFASRDPRGPTRSNPRPNSKQFEAHLEAIRGPTRSNPRPNSKQSEGQLDAIRGPTRSNGKGRKFGSQTTRSNFGAVRYLGTLFRSVLVEAVPSLFVSPLQSLDKTQG